MSDPETPGPGACGVRSLYVHAPFCARRCVYCDFAVQVRRTGDVDGWLEALAGELRGVASEGRFPLASRLDTLYVGGGTPSLLGPSAMAGLARVVGPERLDGPGLEWTAEANPESFTPDVARGWREAGVNRLSLGVQSFDPGVLRWMGRLHGAEGGPRAVATARGAGIHDLSIDLIFGLPEGVARDWDDDLDRAVELGVPHLSVYGLTVEPDTALGRATARGGVAPPDDGRYRDEFLRASERLRAAGYEHYEVSSYALPGHRSRHNAVYWSGAPWLGVGNGAHSYRHPLRRWNIRDWEAYRIQASGGLLAVDAEETLGEDEVRLESVWLGLRTRDGLPLAGLHAGARDRIDRWIASGLAERAGDRIRLTPEGWLRLDDLAVELDEDLVAAASGAAASPRPG